MASFRLRGEIWYARIKCADGEWRFFCTDETERKKAETWAKEREREVAAVRRGDVPPPPSTLTAYAETWLKDRADIGLDIRKDRSNLTHYLLPTLGKLDVAAVRTKHLVDLFHKIRTSPMPDRDERPSQRQVYNIYATACALFRDTVLAELREQTPCILTPRQLGPKVDKDPGWRSAAVFERSEVVTLISDVRIPRDRRVTYALELLAGVRPGESAALRWEHYQHAKLPLGELFVAKSFSSERGITKGTKTEAVKHVPVHPTLAAILAEWRKTGWPKMIGREPRDSDLIVPLPPADAAARTKRDGEPFRTTYYSGRRWRDADLPALGWRARRHYDMRATFITLALEDGADPAIIEQRVTHTKPTRSAFHGYNRGEQWAITCREVAKLNIALVPSMCHDEKGETMSSTSKLRRRVSNRRLATIGDARSESSRAVAWSTPSWWSTVPPDLAHSHVPRSSCDLGLEAMQAAT